MVLIGHTSYKLARRGLTKSDTLSGESSGIAEPVRRGKVVTKMPLLHEQTETYAETHMGYGNPSAKWWLLGAEDGGGQSVEEVCARLNRWQEMGARPVHDLQTFAQNVGHGLDRWFPTPDRIKPPSQPTWRALIRVMLSAQKYSTCPCESIEVSLEEIKEVQSRRWGRTARCGGPSFLSEIQPLPVPNSKEWPYSGEVWWDGGEVPEWATSRTQIVRKFGGGRLDRLWQLFKSEGGHQEARVILIYTGAHREEGFGIYRDIVLSKFGVNSDPSVYQFGRNAFSIWRKRETIFCHSVHTTAHGVPNKYWESVGIEIAKHAMENNLQLQ